MAGASYPNGFAEEFQHGRRKKTEAFFYNEGTEGIEGETISDALYLFCSFASFGTFVVKTVFARVLEDGGQVRTEVPCAIAIGSIASTGTNAATAGGSRSLGIGAAAPSTTPISVPTATGAALSV